MVKVAVTGGIGSGKSTVRELLSSMGAVGIDTDMISRQVVEPGTEGARRIRDVFGGEFFNEDGRLERKKMAAVVFDDPQTRLRLEEILHPLIIEEETRIMENAAAKQPDTIFAVEIPLLTEGKRHERYDRVILVTAPADIRLERLVKSGRYTREEAIARMGHQVTDEARMKVADYIVDNGGSVDGTRLQCKEIMDKIIRDR